MILTKPQAYVLSLLADFRALRTEQVKRLLAAQFRTTSAQAQALLHQLRIKGKIMIRDDCVMLPGRTVNPIVLRAFDVMLALTDGCVAQIYGGNPPIVLVFTVSNDSKTNNGAEEQSAETVFGVVDGSSAHTTGLSGMSAGMRGISSDITLLFMLTDAEQSKTIDTKHKHYFALPDEQGHVRFFVDE